MVVNYASSKAGADTVVADITAKGGNAVAVGGDVSKAAEARGIVEAAVRKYGRLDILVNNSGGVRVHPARSRHRGVVPPPVQHQRARTAAQPPKPPSSTCRRAGTSSTSDPWWPALPPPNSGVYTGTKGAVDAITGVLARELGPKGIRVNALNPRLIATEGTQGAGFIGSEFEKEAVKSAPLGRGGQVDDIAKIAVFLATDDAGWLTGEQILAGGGAR